MLYDKRKPGLKEKYLGQLKTPLVEEPVEEKVKIKKVEKKAKTKKK